MVTMESSVATRTSEKREEEMEAAETTNKDRCFLI
jgi:hypothetical protein